MKDLKKIAEVILKTEIELPHVTAGRTSPFPSNSLKPKIVLKPKEDKDKDKTK